MSRNPLISIVIVAGPLRKKELFRCLSSIEKSTYKNKEVLVVDNSCTEEVALLLKRHFPSVNYYKMPHNTGIFAYNVGFANAKGKYILALDDDCEIKKETLEKIYTTFENIPQNVGIISCNMYNPLKKYYYYQHYLDMHITKPYNFMGGAVAFRKVIFEDVGYYDEDFFCWVHEDDFAARALDKGYELLFSDEIVINHYSDESSNGNKLLLIFRNKAWFSIKNFPIYFFPLLFVKDILWFFSISKFEKDIVRSLFYMIGGTLWGCSTFFIPIKKRKTIAFSLQKKYLQYYVSIFKRVLCNVPFFNLNRFTL